MNNSCNYEYEAAYVCSRQCLWLAKYSDCGQKLLVEKFYPKRKSKHGLYRLIKTTKYPINKTESIYKYTLEIEKDALRFVCETSRLKMYFKKFNSFAHMSKELGLPEEFLNIIVLFEDETGYVRIHDISVQAEGARKKVEERGKDLNIFMNSPQEYS